MEICKRSAWLVCRNEKGPYPFIGQSCLNNVERCYGYMLLLKKLSARQTQLFDWPEQKPVNLRQPDFEPRCLDQSSTSYVLSLGPFPLKLKLPPPPSSLWTFPAAAGWGRLETSWNWTRSRSDAKCVGLVPIILFQRLRSQNMKSSTKSHGN